MNTDQRGSEKLKISCTGLSPLSQRQLEQIERAALPTGCQYYKVFPHGLPSPEPVFDSPPVSRIDA